MPGEVKEPVTLLHVDYKPNRDAWDKARLLVDGEPRIRALKKAHKKAQKDLMTIKITKTDPNAVLPKFATAGSAGADVYSVENFALAPGERRLVDCGFKMEIPPGFEVQCRPRSGLAITRGVTVLNSPGTIDSDYRGPVKVGLINLGDAIQWIAVGDRIAQFVVARVEQMTFVEVEALSETERGEGGFGSTGK